jgi:uncharacterized protein (DUF983 family)
MVGPACHTATVALSTSVMMRRGLFRHCPVCNRGHLFRRWVVMADTCPRCGLVFRRAPGQWLGSWFLNICVAQAAVALVLIVGVAATWPAPPMWAIGLADIGVAIAVPFLFFPFSRTIWTAIDLVMRPLEFGEGVAPGFELDHRVPAGRR